MPLHRGSGEEKAPVRTHDLSAAWSKREANGLGRVDAFGGLDEGVLEMLLRLRRIEGQIVGLRRPDDIRGQHNCQLRRCQRSPVPDGASRGTSDQAAEQIQHTTNMAHGIVESTYLKTADSLSICFMRPRRRRRIRWRGRPSCSIISRSCFRRSGLFSSVAR